MTTKLNNARNSTVIKKKKKSNTSSKNIHAGSTQAVSHGYPQWKLTQQSTTNYYAKQESINSVWSATCWGQMEKCGVFIPSQTSLAIPITMGPMGIPSIDISLQPTAIRKTTFMVLSSFIAVHLMKIWTAPGGRRPCQTNANRPVNLPERYEHLQMSPLLRLIIFLPSYREVTISSFSVFARTDTHTHWHRRSQGRAVGTGAPQGRELKKLGIIYRGKL